MNIGFRLLIISLLVITLAGISTCGSNDKPLEKIDVRLKWIHQAQFAGFYAADQLGFYRDQGLEVNLIPGGPNVPIQTSFDDLLAGRVPFIITGADQVLMHRAKGDPLVALAVIFPRNPYVYVLPENSSIKNPRDFPGKTMMLSPDGVIQHEALLARFDIDPTSVTILPYEKSTEPLKSGRIDAHLLYRTGSALLFDQDGYPVDFVWMENYGIRFYTDTIVTTEEVIRTRPDLVEAFLRATLEGWRYAIENQVEVAGFIRKYDPDVNLSTQLLASKIQAPLIHTGENDIGWMEEKVWQEMNDILQNAGMLPQPVDISKAYTSEFIQRIYDDK